MPPSPTLQKIRRALRVQLPGLPWASIRLEDGQCPLARVQTISITGGLLRVLKPLNPGAVVEVMVWTDQPVLGMAVLLNPCSGPVSLGLQPFRFTAMDDIDLRRLRIAIALSQKCTRASRADLTKRLKDGVTQLNPVRRSYWRFATET
jgi:hypothetical protein